MELQEVKNIWREYDKKLDKQIKLNMHILKKMNLDETKSALETFIKTPVLGVIIGLLLQISLGVFIYSHHSMPQFVIPAVLLGLFALFQVIFSSYQSSVILQIDYNSPVTTIQKKLERLKVHRIRYLAITRFSYGLLWLPVLIVGLKAFLNYDIYPDFNRTWLILSIITGFLFFGFGVWLSFQFTPKKVISPLAQRLVNNIGQHDITGKGLYSAMTFLIDIEDFEKED